MKGKWCIFLFSFFLLSLATSQIDYRVVELGKILNSGTVLGVSDMNGDLQPDLVIVHNSIELWLGLNTGTEEFIWSQIDKKLDGTPWSLNILDVDQNKLNDIVISGEVFGVQSYSQLSKGVFTKTFLDTTKYYSQASSFSDVDNNSFPDLFVCGEFEYSKFYKNISGQLTLDTSKIDLTLNEKDSDIGNYGAIWADIDNDGDQDLYVSRCRPDVSNPTDRRRRNLFFHNMNGSFAEEADARNITVLDQTWVSEIGDLDNDGLQDLVVLNHYTPSLIYKQTPDHKFIDVTSQSGFNYKGNGMQLIMRDYDNDMDLDLLIVGEKNEIWLNQGNMNFENSNTKFVSSIINSCAVADFNTDGAVDILASFGDFINSPNIIRNRIFMAEKSKNHFIGFNLEGQQSNFNAIGSIVRIYVNGIMQMRELRSGESFGITNSYQIHFGLGSNVSVDSVVVNWPNGTQSSFKNLTADQYYFISENGCISNLAKLSTPTKNYICTGDLLVINPNKSYNLIKWNTGSLNNSIIVSNPGIYFFEAQDSNSCKVISEASFVVSNPIQSSRLNYSDQLFLCHQEEVELMSDPIKAIQWNNNINSTTLKVSESGDYYAKIKGLCAEFYTDTITINVLGELKEPVVRDTLISKPSSILLSTDDVNTRWYSSQNSIVPVHQGANYQTGLISSDTEYWLERFSKTSYNSVLHGYPRVNFNTLAFHNQTINGGMYFKVHEDCILDTFKVFTDRVGIRKFILRDDRNNTIDSIEVNLKRGENVILPKFKLSPSIPKYFLTTDSALNRKNFLNISPWLFRSDLGIQYPLVGNLLTFLYSESGEAEYHYFYYCKLRKQDKECTSLRVPLKVKLINSLNDNTYNLPKIEFINNSLIVSNDNQFYSISIYNSSGIQILNMTNTNQSKIPLHNLISGIYFIDYTSHYGKKESLKFMKAN